MVRLPASRGIRALPDVALWVLALLGATCILLVILAVTANVTLILFRTGSMSPAIPAGSVAVVQRIPATDIAVGDVVTVDRAGDLPITHRVVSIAPGATPSERSIVLRGDANDQPDRDPYTVSTVRIVRLSVPGSASFVAALGQPIVLGGLTTGAAALVLWAFWPHGARSTRSTSPVPEDPSRTPAEP